MTMLRRNLKHLLRYPSMSVSMVGMPVIFLLLFVYVFGSTLGDGLGGHGVPGGLGGHGGRGAYIDYVTPGIILMTAVGAATATAVSVATDMTEGVVARFRTMAIARSSILTGHALGSLIMTLLAMAVVTGVALLIGFRPDANAVEWLAAIGLLALFTYAIAWLAVGMGLAAGGPESASNMPMPLLVLPFLGSGFVPTDSMPTALRWFAEYQPFTPLIETLRGLLLGTPLHNSPAQAIGWCVGTLVLGYLWSKKLFSRDPSR
ncbi:ABC transporter permease [Actinomadura barringtoniae]|nr:ABC transporter permease [Actinomadura barringtoniae]